MEKAHFFYSAVTTPFEKEGRCQGRLQREPGTQAGTEQSLAQLRVCQHPCSQDPRHRAAAPLWDCSGTPCSLLLAACRHSGVTSRGTVLHTAGNSMEKKKGKEILLLPTACNTVADKGNRVLNYQPSELPSTLIPGRNHPSALATQEFQPHTRNQRGERSERENTEAYR